MPSVSILPVFHALQARFGFSAFFTDTARNTKVPLCMKRSGTDVRYFQASARMVEKNQTSGISISISLPIFAERQIPSMIAWLMMICEVGTGDSV